MYPRLLLVIVMTGLVVTAFFWAAFVSQTAVPSAPGRSRQNTRVTKTIDPPIHENSAVSAVPTPPPRPPTEMVTGGPAGAVGLKSPSNGGGGPPSPSVGSIGQAKQSDPAQPDDQKRGVSDLSKPTSSSNHAKAPGLAAISRRPIRTKPTLDALSEGTTSGLLKDTTQPSENSFAVVDLYVLGGPHIIIVCDKLTKRQRLRSGCP